MGFQKFRDWVAAQQKEIDDKLTDKIGDGDYTQTTDKPVEKPKDDGKEKPNG